MSELITVPIDQIDANPFRLLADYPYVGRKLEALERSYRDVGMWPGVVARKNGNRYQVAFGHHRIEGARRFGLTSVLLIVEDLSDEKMLQYMGRENLEDYNADFLVMLETWEAAVAFLARHGVQNPQATEIARLLGWTRLLGGKGDRRNSIILTDTAQACHAAHALINGGYLAHDELRDTSVRAAREHVQHTWSRMELLEKVGKQTQQPAEEIERAKQHLGKAVKFVAKQYHEGHGIGIKDVRGRIDVQAYRYAQEAKKQSPLFSVFANAAVEAIERMLNGDTTADKLAEIEKFVPEVVAHEDHAALRRLDYVLGELSARTSNWQKRLKPNKVSKLSSVKELTHG